MKDTVSLTVPGEPIPNARARKGKRGFYTPRPTVEYRERVQAAWMVEGRLSLGDGPLELQAVFVCGRKSSHLLADGSPRAGAPRFPPCDTDNLVKSATDALNGLLYRDDVQLVKIVAVKRYAQPGEEPHTEIEIGPHAPVI